MHFPTCTKVHVYGPKELFFLRRSRESSHCSYHVLGPIQAIAYHLTSAALAVWSMWDFGLLHYHFPGICIPSCFSSACNTQFLHNIFSIIQPSLSWRSNGTFLFWDILKQFLHTFFFWHSFHIITLTMAVVLKFEVLSTALWNVTSCALVDGHWLLKECAASIFTIPTKVIATYYTTWCQIWGVQCSFIIYRG